MPRLPQMEFEEVSSWSGQGSTVEEAARAAIKAYLEFMTEINFEWSPLDRLSWDMKTEVIWDHMNQKMTFQVTIW